MTLFFRTSFAQDVSPRITIQADAISVEDLLKEISRQSGVHFSYNPRSIDAGRRISFSVRNATLEATLDKLAGTIPIGYTVIEDQIVLNRREQEEKRETESFTISGFITDGATGESLIGATVQVLGEGRGANTNGFGYYALNLPAGSYTLEYAYLGYAAERIVIDLQAAENRDVGLQTAPLSLPDVIIETPLTAPHEEARLGRQELRREDLEKLPEFGGESGLIRGLQSLPGLKTHSDGSAFFFVRGGEKDQNMIIIDDAPIYNPAHLFGFYSLVIPDFTKTIHVHKSDIPVRLGDRLSSIVDVRTKDGNLNKFQFSGAFNPLLTRLSLEGPVVRGKSSFFTSLRRSNFQWIYRRNNPDLELNFGDFSFKWNYKINNNNRLFLTVISGGDLLSNLDGAAANRAGVQWNNFAATIRWNHIFGPKLFSNTVLYTGNYQYKLSSTTDAWHSGIGKLSLKSDFTHYAAANLTTRFGFEIQGYAFNPGKILEGPLIDFFPSIRQDYSRQNVLYYHADLRLGKRWRLGAGIRSSRWENLGPAEFYTFDEQYEPADTVSAGEGVYQKYARMDPRLSLAYEIGRSSSLKLSYGIYHQYVQLISNSTSPFSSFEVWLPSSRNIKPQRAEQVALGYNRYFPKAGLSLGAEFYHKRMANQIDYEPHARTLLNPLVEGELRFGRMRSYGVEVMLRKDRGRLNGWLSYTYSRALRQTDGVNGGREYPAFQDRPHDLSILLNYQLTERISGSAYWTAYTGSAFSSPTGFYRFNNYTAPIYGEKHNDRLPDYRRLDLAFKFVLNKNPGNRYQHSLTFSIYNALAHRNVVDVNFNKILENDRTPVVRANTIGREALVATQTDLVRFLPSLTYKFQL